MPKKQNETKEKMQLTVDYAFKRVFGKNGNESILKDFLESILNIEIKNITIQNPEIPKNMKDGKIGVLDVRAELNGNEIIEVEMQVQDQHNIDKRSPTYLTKIYSDQLQEGEQYIEVKKVVVINILNFNYYKRNSYHSVARMIFEESKENEKVDLGYTTEEKYATNDLEMHFIELKKKDPDMSNKLEQWLCLICDEEDKIKMAESKNEEIEKAKKELEKLAMNPEDRELYELRLKAIRDEMNIRYSGYIDGMAEKSIEIAKNMLKENVNLELISKVTGLSLEEIENLK